MMNWFYLLICMKHDFFMSLPGEIAKLWYVHNMEYCAAIISSRSAYTDVLYCRVTKADSNQYV